MARVLFLGNSRAQLDSLPIDVRGAFEWAIGELRRAPDQLPQRPELGLETKGLEGPYPLFRIALRPVRHDPGYRAVYSVEGATVRLLRFSRRDAAPYKSLRRFRGTLPSGASREDGRP